jgi:hypothetical protein
MPIVRLAMEYPPEHAPPGGPTLAASMGGGPEEVIADVQDHGGPVTVRG